MKHTEFETGQPLFTTEELNDAVSFTASIISEAIRTRNFNRSDWKEKIDQWGLANYQTKDVIEHISAVIMYNFNIIQKNG